MDKVMSKRELKDQLMHYRKVNKLTYSEFCEKFNIDNDTLVNLQCGSYDRVSTDIINRIVRFIYE